MGYTFRSNCDKSPAASDQAVVGNSVNRTIASLSGLPSQGSVNISVISVVIRMGWPFSKYGR